MHSNTIAMPFSGGQDSFMNLLLQVREEGEPIHLFYFRMKSLVSFVEEDYVKSLVPKFKQAFNFEDIRLHFVDAFDLRAVGQEPNPFVPFRNYYFGQYLLGMGFKKLLFSFSAEDALFHDTSDLFMEELAQMTRNNMGFSPKVYTRTRNMGRIDYVRYLLDNYGADSDAMQLFRECTYSCSEEKPCRACMCCLTREISEMWFRQHTDDGTSSQGAIKAFIRHWQGHTTLRDLYRRVMTSQFTDPIVRDVYWKFLESFEKGALLKGLV